jgi:TM2 domain-containing membrane protein YozV
MQLNNSVLLLGDLLKHEDPLFLEPFDDADKYKIQKLYNRKINPQYKSPTKAVILSALIPGLGKVYANETSDGITSFLLTGIFTYLAVNKFQNNHTSSGILYASIATFFYAGNIYGSASAVHNYNTGLKISFNKDVKIFINERNQFLPTPKYLCD